MKSYGHNPYLITNADERMVDDEERAAVARFEASQSVALERAVRRAKLIHWLTLPLWPLLWLIRKARR